MLVLRKGRQVCAFKLLLSKREHYDTQDLTQRIQERSPRGSEVAVVIDTKGQILDFTKAEKRAQIRVQVKEGASGGTWLAIAAGRNCLVVARVTHL